MKNLILVVTTALMLAACGNTVSGIGQDITSMGDDWTESWNEEEAINEQATE